MITEKAAAKINLGLDTPFQYKNGDQEWQMVMSSVDLSDYVDLTLSATSQIRVNTDSGFLPEDYRNLAYQAAYLLQKTYQVTQGATIRIRKRIPVAAGLGGGSSDAAAVLRGLNRLWHLNLSLTTLAHLGLKIDSDVPYCVFSQTAFISGRGDLIQLLPELPPFWVVLAKPRVSVSTPSILRVIAYNEELNHPEIKQLVQAIKQNNYEKMITTMGNVLEPITSQHHPEVQPLAAKMRQFGADVVQMSGSGPTIFGLCNKQSRAQHVYNSMRGFCQEVYLVRSLH
ncbi:4-(cytidine 5'-diphospho)-2-C-methyl-D-erythritol kinase [Loigolactobacillus iwatensis]|uniref:4-(cytidine 5'-diphospho)-2-C-methyl-D-erythritol kinase n=1 Tax=Loigolactobacillus iwatensis TaxID=1267156 RepID=UPI000F7E7248|nr:4-(cytidine 5'-diphospho)-2-C-methyl-D-erythritol kinase [Loigolactobacillus iwatensis]